MELISDISPTTYVGCLITLWLALGPIFIWKKCPERRNRDLVPVFVFISVVGTFGFLGTVAGGFGAAHQRSTLRADLKRLQHEHASVSLNGDPYGDPDLIIDELLRMDFPEYHHSSGAARIDVHVIGSAGTLRILLRQDERFRDEFWVFAPPVEGRARLATLESPLLREWLEMQQTRESTPTTQE